MSAVQDQAIIERLDEIAVTQRHHTELLEAMLRMLTPDAAPHDGPSLEDLLRQIGERLDALAQAVRAGDEMTAAWVEELPGAVAAAVVRRV